MIDRMQREKAWKILTVLYGDQTFSDVGQIKTGDDFNSCSDNIVSLIQNKLTHTEDLIVTKNGLPKTKKWHVLVFYVVLN